MYDVVVVGARCAGSPLAMLLARRGHRVLLVDRVGFPSDTISTHYLWVSGAAALSRWGLLDAVAGSGCPPISRITTGFGDLLLTGSPPGLDGVEAGYCPRRTVLDGILVDAAVAAGAEFRPNFTVEGLLDNDGSAAGIRGHERGGPAVEEQARVVVGADGRHSRVAELVGAGSYREVPPLSCAHYSYWSGIDQEVNELRNAEGRTILLSPTNDGLTVVGVWAPASEMERFRVDLDAAFTDSLSRLPEVAERVSAGRREERFYGTADLANFFRVPFGPGWALVGDAGYHRDPISAQGIDDAFRHAEVLAEALHRYIASELSWAEALTGYQQTRDHAVSAIYEMTCGMASFAPPPPDMAQLFQALAHNQTQCDRFYGILAGTVAYDEFFSPDNLADVQQRA